MEKLLTLIKSSVIAYLYGAITIKLCLHILNSISSNLLSISTHDKIMLQIFFSSTTTTTWTLLLLETPLKNKIKCNLPYPQTICLFLFFNSSSNSTFLFASPGVLHVTDNVQFPYWFFSLKNPF